MAEDGLSMSPSSFVVVSRVTGGSVRQRGRDLDMTTVNANVKLIDAMLMRPTLSVRDADTTPRFKAMCVASCRYRVPFDGKVTRWSFERIAM